MTGVLVSVSMDLEDADAGICNYSIHYLRELDPLKFKCSQVLNLVCLNFTQATGDEGVYA